MIPPTLLILMSLMPMTSSSHPNQEIKMLPALQQRTDVGYAKKTRDLHTTLSNPKVFSTLYPNTDVTCGYVIRYFFHTNIHFNAPTNHLISMDGRSFELNETTEIQLLTKEVVDLIGGMYFGSGEYGVFVEKCIRK